MGQREERDDTAQGEDSTDEKSKWRVLQFLRTGEGSWGRGGYRVQDVHLACDREGGADRLLAVARLQRTVHCHRNERFEGNEQVLTQPGVQGKWKARASITWHV